MLSAEQLKAREGKMTGTRIKPIMDGDPVGIDRVYKILIGEEIEEDLSDNFQVRLGELSEDLNLEWWERRQKSIVTRRGEVVQHPFLPWAVATLDGWNDELRCVIECKHTNTRDPVEIIRDRSAAQVQWLLECTGANQCALSVIRGNEDPVLEFIERDADYANVMIERASAFMLCVKLRRPPVALAAVPAPIDHEALIDVDMTENEKWKYAAQNWCQVAGAAETAANMTKALKALMPENARRAFGWGAQITRSKANALSLRVQQ